jgi:hypothetical protein
MAKTTQSAHSNTNSDSTAVTVLAANINRTALLIQNDSDTDTYIAFNQAAVANTGVRLEQAGVANANMFFSEQLGNLDKGYVSAINATGSKDLLVTEWST